MIECGKTRLTKHDIRLIKRVRLKVTNKAEYEALGRAVAEKPAKIGLKIGVSKKYVIPQSKEGRAYADRLIEELDNMGYRFTRWEETGVIEIETNHQEEV